MGRQCRIIKYSELSKYSDLDQLLSKDKDYVVILIENSPNEGHWCGLLRYTNMYERFDSYGFPVDADLKWATLQKRKQLHEDIPYSSNLLDKVIKSVYIII